MYLAVNLWTQLRWKCRHSPHCIEALCTALCLHTNRWAFEGCIKVPHRPSWPTSRRTLCSSCLTAFVKRWFAPSLVRRKGLRSGKFCLYYEQYIYIYVFWLMVLSKTTYIVLNNTIYPFTHSLEIKAMTLELPASCSTVWIGSNN